MLKYGQKVRVKSGFYEGMEGTVKMELYKFSLFSKTKEYIVEIKTPDFPIRSTMQIIPEYNLEIIL